MWAEGIDNSKTMAFGLHKVVVKSKLYAFDIQTTDNLTRVVVASDCFPLPNIDVFRNNVEFFFGFSFYK